MIKKRLDMKRVYTLLLFAMLSLAGAMAQGMGSGFVSNGYYRIRNVGSQRYLYVTDNKDYYNMSTDKEDFQAIQLWKESGRDFTCDPGSVVYIKQVGNQFDLEAQGTGVHQLTGYYVSVEKQGDGSYIVSASVSKAGMQVTKYLTENEKSTAKPQGKMGTSGTLNYRKWVVDQIGTTHATNYFGLKPGIESEGKFYQSFYAAFPFRVTNEDIHIYTVSKVAGGKAILTELTGDIPAYTPVIIECASNNPSENRLELLPPSDGSVKDNLLTGNFFCNGNRPETSADAFTIFKPATMRVLAVKDGKLTFCNSVTDTPSLTLTNVMIDWSNYIDSDELCISANSAYLKVAENCAADLTVQFGEGTPIGKINADKADADIYDLQGRKLDSMQKGINIVGGKKYIVK